MTHHKPPPTATCDHCIKRDRVHGTFIIEHWRFNQITGDTEVMGRCSRCGKFEYIPSWWKPERVKAGIMTAEEYEREVVAWYNKNVPLALGIARKMRY